MMSTVTISSLLSADEERIRNELKADAIVDKNRRQSVIRLDETLSHILLRYNAAHVEDGRRQALADAEAADVKVDGVINIDDVVRIIAAILSLQQD